MAAKFHTEIKNKEVRPMPDFNIDTAILQGQLEELTGPNTVKVKLNKHIDTASSVRCTDGGYVLQLNPYKIRSQAKLDKHLELARQIMGVG